MTPTPADPIRDACSLIELFGQIRSTAHLILLALVLDGPFMQAKDIRRVTNFQNRAITRGIQELEEAGIIYWVNRPQGWTLRRQWKQSIIPILYEDISLVRGQIS